MAKEIPLTQGKVAIVDERDYLCVAQYKWYAHKAQTGGWYAIRNIKVNGKKTAIKMHRFILDATAGVYVDHKDLDGLNNRRQNIRICTRQQNGANRKIRKKSKASHFTGVHWRTDNKKWRVCIKSGPIAPGTQGRRQETVGHFTDEVAAAKAYDAAARKVHGRFARLNFPKGK